MEVHYHFIRERVVVGDVDLQYINTNLQTADILRKTLEVDMLVHTSRSTRERNRTAEHRGPKSDQVIHPHLSIQTIWPKSLSPCYAPSIEIWSKKFWIWLYTLGS